MGISLSAQTAYFLWSLVFGLALGALYDLVRAARMILRAGRVHVMISDVVFFTICGILTSLFSLPFNKGDVRAFILFGEAVGFLTYRLTLGSVMGKVYAFFARLLRSFVQKIRKILEKIFNYLLKAIAVLLYNVGVVIDKSRRKAQEKKRSHRAAAAKAKAKRRRRRADKGRIYEKKKYKKTADRGSNSDRYHRRSTERR